ncbi:MAG: hypothetical protein OHK0029_38520 [Armatimonadaceae bacterium]
MKKQFSIAALAALSLIGAAALPAQAQLIAADSYLIGTDPTAGEYQAGVFLRSQPDNLQNTGFVNGRYAGGTGTSQFTATTVGLVNTALGADTASSGKVTYAAAPLDNVARSNARNLATPVPTSNTYWLGHLVNRGNIPGSGGNGFVLSGFGNATVPLLGTTSGNTAGLFVGFAQNGVTGNFGSLIIRHRTGANFNSDEVLINGATTSTFGTTYFVVMKLEVNVNGGQDRVTWWLNPTSLLSEADLTATAAATNTFNSFALQGATDFVRLNYVSQNWNGTAFFDEPRLGITLQETFGVSAAPEPGTMALALLGLGAFAAIHRRNRKL